MSDLAPETRAALILKLTALADDELLLSHRDSEWIGHAPILEEDIALANLAQDELGHAGVWLSLRGALDGSDPDALVYGRSARDFLSARMLELPRGDWAFTLLRQFLFDAYEAVWLDAAKTSEYQPLRETVLKIVREERFHLQHTALWTERLGLGTAESNRRAQNALNELWPLTPQLFAPLPGEAELAAARLVPELPALYEPWRAFIVSHLERSGLTAPPLPHQEIAPRTSHTQHLAPLLREMQQVARGDEEALAW